MCINNFKTTHVKLKPRGLLHRIQCSIIFTIKVTAVYSPTFLKGEKYLRELGFHQLLDSCRPRLQPSSARGAELELISAA